MVLAWRGAGAQEVDPRVAELVAGTIGVDTHNHIDVAMTTDAGPGPEMDLAGELRKSGLSAICATFSVDRPNLTRPGEAYERFLNALKAMDGQLEKNQITRSLNLSDLKTSHGEKKPAVVQAVEGGHFVEGEPERIGKAYESGLRVLGLLHDNDTEPPLGDIYTNEPRHGGLTDLGAKVIEECNRLGILVDLTHASTETVKKAMKVSKKPVVFSHTGLDTRLGDNPGMGQMMKARLISRDHAKAIADAGGVVGVWTHLVNSPAEYVQAIRAMVDAAGVDHVCIGTDTKMVPGAQGGRGPGGRGPGGPGGGQGRGRMGGGTTNQAWADMKVGIYHAVIAEMVKQGFKDEEVGKIGGGNFCRVFAEATGGKG